ncbi:hypothetical protein [Corallococcus exercitus]|uniref:hypothetical protein n=1 Tax=Corallococcus exercitus TaxID=2316736 RepID=UPI0011C3A2C0|nr:hypothetical protein [Corallococcus exercitus]
MDYKSSAMHQIDVPSGELNEFDLPPVCVVTGERQGVVFKPVKFSWYPRWIGFLFLLNVLIAIIVASAMTKRVKGTLPFTEEAWSRWRRGQILTSISAVTALALLVTAIALLVAEEPLPLGLVVLALGVAVPLLTWIFFARGRGPQVLRIDKDAIALAIPNADAARTIMDYFVAGLRPAAWAEDGQDAEGTPVRAICARHDDIVASGVCPRCGAFMCPRCENRTREQASPLCPGCWELRARSIKKAPESFFTAPNVGLQLGLVSLIPFCFIVQPVSLVLNIVNLVKARREGGSQRDQRKAIASLILTGLGTVLTVALYILGSQP